MNNKKIILFILSFFIFILIINNKPNKIKPNKTTPKPQGLNASFGKKNNLGLIPTNNVNCINFSFTTPASFGIGANSFTQVILYLSAGSTTANDSNTNPYTTTKIIPIDDITDPTKNFINSTYNKISSGWFLGNGIGEIDNTSNNSPTDDWKTNKATAYNCFIYQSDINNTTIYTAPVSGNYYWFGVAIANNNPISPPNADFPNIISNFSFVNMQFIPSASDAVTSLVGSFGVKA